MDLDCQKWKEPPLKVNIIDLNFLVLMYPYGVPWSLLGSKKSWWISRIIHTCTNLISMVVTRAMSNSSKTYAFLICWIWKMGWNLFSSLDIRKNPRVCQIQDLCRKKYKKGIFSDVQWWKQISTHFSDSTHQECIIFARIGHGSCYYHWNEIFAGVCPLWLR